jgi:glycine/D-amino acid oxidase-like deaminating enzyme
MREHRSPWFEGLPAESVTGPLSGRHRADVVVVGGGIAGVATATELLERSEVSVMLLESDRIAHGASGNGSGQVAAAFEGGFAALSERFGPDLAKAAYRQIAQARRRFGKIVRTSGSSHLVHRVNSYIGFSSIDTVDGMISASADHPSLSQPAMRVYAAAGSGWNCQLRDRGVKAVRVPPERILKILGTEDESYRAAAVSRTNVANVPSICRGLVRRMHEIYPGRFTVHERTKVMSVHSRRPMQIVCENGQVECKKVILCTNGYQLPDLNGTPNSLPYDYLKCVTGFMNGYRPPDNDERVGLFFNEVQPSVDEPYVFSTTWRQEPRKPLLMIGGPQYTCNDGELRESLDERAHARIDKLAAEIYGMKEKAIQYWDGRMGYTSSGVRLAGSDPRNPDLFYNLGCNGIGILHSVYGASRVVAEITERRMEGSVFEPRNQFK